MKLADLPGVTVRVSGSVDGTKYYNLPEHGENHKNSTTPTSATSYLLVHDGLRYSVDIYAETDSITSSVDQIFKGEALAFTVSIDGAIVFRCALRKVDLVAELARTGGGVIQRINSLKEAASGGMRQLSFGTIATGNTLQEPVL